MMSHSTAEDVLSASQLALGPRALVDAIHSVTARARCSGPRGPYEADILSARGGRMLFKQRWLDRPPFNATISGTNAWTRKSETDAVSPLDAESIVTITGHDFQMLAIDLLAHFHTPTLMRYRQFAGVECYELGAYDALGHLNRAFFRVSDARWAGLEIPDSRDLANPPVVVTIDAWRAVEGVVLPSQVTATDVSGAYVFNFHTLSLNDVDSALFTIPDEFSA